MTPTTSSVSFLTQARNRNCVRQNRHREKTEEPKRTRHIHLNHPLDVNAFLFIHLGNRLTAQQASLFGRVPMELDSGGGRRVSGSGGENAKGVEDRCRAGSIVIGCDKQERGKETKQR